MKERQFLYTQQILIHLLNYSTNEIITLLCEYINDHELTVWEVLWAFLGNAPTGVPLPTGDRPEATWKSLLRRGGAQGDSQGDRDGVEASVSGDIAQQPGSLEVREVWRAAVAWGLTATGSVLSTASRCWGKVCRECKAGRLSTANGLLNGAVFKTTGCVKTPVWVGRLWSFRVSACSEEPTNLGGHPWLTDTTGVSGAGLQAVTRENQNDTLRWSLKNA